MTFSMPGAGQYMRTKNRSDRPVGHRPEGHPDTMSFASPVSSLLLSTLSRVSILSSSILSITSISLSIPSLSLSIPGLRVLGLVLIIIL